MAHSRQKRSLTTHPHPTRRTNRTNPQFPPPPPQNTPQKNHTHDQKTRPRQTHPLHLRRTHRSRLHRRQPRQPHHRNQNLHPQQHPRMPHNPHQKPHTPIRRKNEQRRHIEAIGKSCQAFTGSTKGSDGGHGCAHRGSRKTLERSA
ncbi:Hypothetical protein Cul210931_1873 [Corynebacterium ulcerans]|nr:Hypothetical protein Cul210931_1873 [Corynebacterium ulcerans]